MILQTITNNQNAATLLESLAPPAAPFNGHLQAASSKVANDAQRLRDQAQERLAEALRIAQSRAMPHGVAPVQANLTNMAEKEMATATPGDARIDAADQAHDAAAPREQSQRRNPAAPPRPDAPNAREQSSEASSNTTPQSPSQAARQGPAAPPPAMNTVTGTRIAAQAAKLSSKQVAPAIGVVGGVAATRGAAAPSAAARSNLAVSQFRSLAGTAFRLGAPKPGAPSPQTESRALTTQVVRGLALALKQGTGRVTLRLHPEHLGQVVVRVSIDKGQVKASLKATDASARRLLTDSSEDLRAALEARGLSVERIDIEPGATELAQSSTSSGTGGDSSPGRNAPNTDAAPRTSAEETPPGASEIAWAIPAGARISRDDAGAVLTLEALA